jgi:hypothetical protein
MTIAIVWDVTPCSVVVSSCNVMAHGDAREGKWRGKWRMEWVASTLHTTSKHGVSSITTADAHTSAANSRLNWRPRRFKWTCPFRRKTKSGFCACAITFQTQSTTVRTFQRNLPRRSLSHRLIYPHDGGYRILRNIGTCVADNMSSLPRTWRSSPSVNIPP